MALGYLIVLGGRLSAGPFFDRPAGRPIANDFVNVWAAGRLALDGRLPPPTTGPLHRAAEVRAVGYDFDGYYGWHYPPPAFFFAAALATLPYLVAAVIWLLATLAAYAAAIAGILGASHRRSCSRSDFPPRSGTSPPDKTVFSPRR